jgi:hypothetical protein
MLRGNIMRLIRPRFTPILLPIIALILTACASNTNSAPVYTRVSDVKLKAGSAIPAPTGDVIVTVDGKIGTKNAGETIQMDMPTLESVGLVDYKVDDPFEKRPTVFRGVLMSDLLDLWKVDSSATTLTMVALNDYKVDVPMADLRKYPVIFAVQQDGKYMPVSTRGPAMLVFPYANFEFDRGKYDDFWIWQIKSITVK